MAISGKEIGKVPLGLTWVDSRCWSLVRKKFFCDQSSPQVIMHSSFGVSAERLKGILHGTKVQVLGWRVWRVPGRRSRFWGFCGFTEALGFSRAELSGMNIGFRDFKMTTRSFQTSLPKWDPLTRPGLSDID